MLTQHDFDSLSSPKSCYSSDTNATVSVLQRFSSSNNVLTSSSSSSRSTREIHVESSRKEFLAERFHDAYPMYKNPRGSCLIINVYNINGAIRRWSDFDVKLLSDLFRQLYFRVTVYSDFNGDDLTAENFMKILKEFAQSKEHADAQCCVICLMSHGEEGSLTVQDGKKIYHDHVFDLFSNANCPNLAGKPKLFFIQCCRDDPGVGPVDDAGCHVSISSNPSFDDLIFEDDECDSAQRLHLPTMSDMLIAFPSQKGFTAFRKPHVGSWYMNALVDILSKHAKDTDLCSMLNMVNGCVSREVTNKGKKQTAEYKSSFTRKSFYFFPGLTGNPIAPIDYSIHNRNRSICEESTNRSNVDDQRDSSTLNFDLIKKYFIENLLDKWKIIARELEVDENQIERISRENRLLKEKFGEILDTIASNRQQNLRQILVDLLKCLKQCRRMSHYYELQQLVAPFYSDLS